MSFMSDLKNKLRVWWNIYLVILDVLEEVCLETIDSSGRILVTDIRLRINSLKQNSPFSQ